MPIATRNNVIVVTHHGSGSVKDAETLCRLLRAEVEKVISSGKRVAILHDSTALDTASEAYARVFSHCFEEIKQHQPVQVAQIEKALLRVFAIVAMKLNRHA